MSSAVAAKEAKRLIVMLEMILTDKVGLDSWQRLGRFLLATGQ